MPGQTATELVWYLLPDTYGKAVAERFLNSGGTVYEANAVILIGFVAAQLSVFLFRGAGEFGLGTSAALTAKVVELKSCDARLLLVTVIAAVKSALFFGVLLLTPSMMPLNWFPQRLP
ncbi:hypothetical protein BCR33DRAFT_728263 [Rhizoclosmatium globosum]|uniref:Uncharacterized protein n=1 Tax=Rhizoclosmatium globosum TaxID=329046 RepID=A0A1Y2AKH8_9FUNG|nr:hypothetical protein BCR33DRAFT_728263 [Rhizoclosmatium globosum]|eukprot:ORY23078.1 hypothetical protein BCR33DRAFT_728263 [Rhizoclosmatium globosum]